VVDGFGALTGSLDENTQVFDEVRLTDVIRKGLRAQGFVEASIIGHLTRCDVAKII
jgi:hypothetical protein